ncbi:putative protein IMPACT [Glarea lozoyensis 74030]|uniref:Impact N-terminal domain-containing protein n=1 Tax=Glarea lozoyensis (strain ATCC 74030 / MF5533) TaxID=1104152 RepID=H0EE98_GLAL7|nr:putative protein IMPACT [Glarea lozoyensis 74030]
MSLKAPSELALSSEVEDEDVIHVDPIRHMSKQHGGAGRLDSTEDLGPTAENDGYHDEHHYGIPILASDEVAKEPFGYELQPAVSPLQERHNPYHEGGGIYHHGSTSQTSLSNSRPSSRPGSIHGNMSGLRLPSDSTKLEDLEEYEPLFPEEDEKNDSKRPSSVADRFKRPDLKNRKFPSQDVWEDSPDSVHHTATVSTPQLPEETETEKMAEPDETPEQAFARRQEELAEKEANDKGSFLNKEKKPWGNKAHIVDETRPGLAQRFPSRDIWEDTPDSLQLQTTVERAQSPEREIASPSEAPLEERPTTGGVAYHQEKAAAGFPLGNGEGRATTGIAATLKPAIPSRPAKSSKLAQSPEKPQPAIPDRPRKTSDATAPPLPTKTKPVVPARPSKPPTRESSENIPLSQVASNSSAKSVGSDQGSAAAAKPKPPVPTRPVGSKIAALQGGFMADLNKRLQLGALPPKKEEPIPEPEVEKEKAPLVDARKGRARGPARRAPAAKSPSPSAAAASSQEKPSMSLSFSVPATLWEIHPEQDLLHVSSHKESSESTAPTKASESATPTLATNTAGDPVHEPLEIAEGAEKSSSPPSAVADEQSQHREEVQKINVLEGADEKDQESAPVKVNDEPPVASKFETSQLPPVEQAREDQEDAMTASVETVKASEVPLPKEEEFITDVSNTDLKTLKTALSTDEKTAKSLLTACKAQLKNPTPSNKRSASDPLSPASKRLKSQFSLHDVPETPQELEASLALPTPSVDEEAISKSSTTKWTVSSTITSKKSTFVARSITITSQTQATHALSTLLSDPTLNLSSASHNITAYRLLAPSGHINESCSDDGESGGGRHILKILQDSNLTNVLLVVTRWYGGIMLGPDRWRIMSDVSRDALSQRLRVAGVVRGEALWGLDLENSETSHTTSPLTGAGLPIHRPEGARAYLLKSFPSPPGPPDVKGKKKTVAQINGEKEENLGLLLGALEMLFVSWRGLGREELERRAWGWYVAVRPEVEGGVAGWGGKGDVRLNKIWRLSWH